MLILFCVHVYVLAQCGSDYMFENNVFVIKPKLSLDVFVCVCVGGTLKLIHNLNDFQT